MSTSDFRKFGNFLKKNNLTHRYWACVHKQGYSRKTIREMHPSRYINTIRNFRHLSTDDFFWRVMDTYWQISRTGTVL